MLQKKVTSESFSATITETGFISITDTRNGNTLVLEGGELAELEGILYHITLVYHLNEALKEARG